MNFYELVKSGDYVILDTETTGLYKGSEIVQIGLLDSHGKTLIDTLIKPVKPIPADATRIHGITNEMVATAAPWLDVRAVLMRYIQAKNVIIYNADYDVSMLFYSDQVNGLAFSWSDHVAGWHCAMTEYAEQWGEWDDYHGNYRWQRLSAACSQQRIEVIDAHNALGDCVMTWKLINKMAEDHELAVTPNPDED